jgi:hypothetical protein
MSQFLTVMAVLLGTYAIVFAIEAAGKRYSRARRRRRRERNFRGKPTFTGMDKELDQAWATYKHQAGIMEAGASPEEEQVLQNAFYAGAESARNIAETEKRMGRPIDDFPYPLK